MKRILDIKQLNFYLWTAAAFLLLYSFVESFAYPGTIIPRVINSFLLVMFITVLNFILFEFTLPFIKLTLKWVLIGFLLIASLLVFYTFGLYAWRYFWIQADVYTSFIPDTSLLNDVLVHSQFSFTYLFFFTIVRHIYNYTKLISTSKQLRIEKQEAELNYLKSQTNPHFLFNTLNNIYSLSRDKSDLAPESILRLSKILRFMLYETSGEYIAIEEELKILSDYIALEKLRYDDSLTIKFNKVVEDIKQPLPPLLLIPLVENAFKHGVSETRNQPFVDIQLSISNQQLLFIVKNSVEESSDLYEVKENIGLSNLRRQLQLLYKDYNLTVQKETSVFTSSLTINLLSHV
ncbi:sensor histidine kinase [Sediminibacterium sp.]|uniref:sensor histidine kinase n=1 Tax=Sediminibacterium sp. TaxID=1917865 RepID=UPI003F6F097D